MRYDEPRLVWTSHIYCLTHVCTLFTVSLLHELKVPGLLGCMFITAGPIIKLCAEVDTADDEGHVLRETTSRGMCGLVCPSRTSEREGKGHCVKGGWRGEDERVEERARRSVNPIENNFILHQ